MMQKRTLAIILALVMLISVFVVGCEKKEEEFKVGFVYIGPPGDAGWTYAHDQGANYLAEELGIEVLKKESVAEDTGDIKKVIRDMVDQGAKLIFATSFGYMDDVVEMAKEFPDVKFMHCSGYKTNDDNMGNYFGRIYEPRFLSGLVAGLQTKTNKIGYVAAFEIPEVIRGINAFTLGVRAVNPQAEVHVRWTHTWYNPADEKAAAEALLAEGVDVMAQHQDTPNPQIAAEEQGAFAIGYNSDTREQAPKAFLTAPIWNWGPYYVEQAKAVQEGKWEVEQYWGGMSDGIVELADLTDLVNPGTKEVVESYMAVIEDGSFNVFQGPIKDQSGEVRCEEGQVIDDGELLGSMNWFVEGVVGEIVE